MTTYGLTITGFVPKPLLVIKEELETAFKSAFGENIRLIPESVFGQIVGIMSERESLLWELSQAVHSAFDPDAAQGSSLDAMCAITGTIREEATKSQATIICVGNSGTVLAVDRIVSVVTVGTRFLSTFASTIVGVMAWLPLTAYMVGETVKNSGKVYRCITAGTSAASGGPTTTDSDITDGTVHWKHLGTGDGFVEVPFEAEDTGPLTAVAGTLTVIETPVSGWNAAVNLTDADEGRDLETDAALRIRREDEIAAGGNGTVEAIRQGVLDVDGVEACFVFENPLNTTSGDGLPPHSVEVLAQGGEDSDIREAIFDNVCAGIETFGSVSGTVIDSQGFLHTIKFSRPTELEVYIDITVTKDPGSFVDSESVVKDTLVAFGDLYPIGKDVYATALKTSVFVLTGVLDASPCKIGLAPSPTTETTIAVGIRQRVVFDTSRITVTLVDATP